MDINGNLIIDYQFDAAQPFSEGLAAVRIDGKWGYIANPLIYSSWEPDEIDRARALGLIPTSENSGSVLCGEFAFLLKQALDLEENSHKLPSINEDDPLTRKSVACIVARSAELKGKYGGYFLPDTEDRCEITEDARFQIGFAIQTGIIKLIEYHYHENAEVSRDEAYEIILRVYEYLLG